MLDEPQWRELEEQHVRCVDQLTAGHRERSGRGQKHPVEDFLFTYYSYRPAQLRRWHPGPDVVLLGERARDRLDWRWYREVEAHVDGQTVRGVSVDVDGFLADRGDTVAFVGRLVAASAGRPAHLGCFGMHEWAMVYGLREGQQRHQSWPLRLGQSGTDAVVESRPVRCSHYDAFRFFTDRARPLNTLQPNRSRQVELEQPGCLHAGMDLLNGLAYTSWVTTASLYLRISDDPTGKQAGVQRQEKECRELCARLGFDAGHVFMDNDISATSGKVRPAFESLLKSKPQVIVTWHTDRLVRITRDLERVIELGVNVHAVTAGHLDLSTPAGRAVARTITAWATYEGEQKAARQKAAARQRAADGKAWWPRRPFGFELDGTLRQDEAASLFAVYSQVLAGVPLTQAARELNEAGHVTNVGNPWTATSLRPVLLNARNAGIKVYGGEEIGPAAWEAIVPEETYRAVVRLLGAPERKTGGGGAARYLLSGVATCGKCGAPCRAAWRGKDRGPAPYVVYSCRGKHCVSQRQEWVDAYVTERVLLRLTDPDASALWAVDESGALEEARGEAVSARERLEALADDYADGVITRAQLARATERLRGRLEAAEATMARLGGDSPLTGLLSGDDVRAQWAALPLDRQRAVVKALMRTVRIMPRGKGVRDMKPEHVQIDWHGQASSHLTLVS